MTLAYACINRASAVMMARRLIRLVALCLLISPTAAQEGAPWGMIGLDEPPSTTEESVVLADDVQPPIIAADTTTTQPAATEVTTAAHTTQALEIEITTVENKTTTAVTLKDTMTQETATDIAATEGTTARTEQIETTQTDITPTEATQAKFISTTATSSENTTTEVITTDATPTEAISTDVLQTESTETIAIATESSALTKTTILQDSDTTASEFTTGIVGIDSVNTSTETTDFARSVTTESTLESTEKMQEKPIVQTTEDTIVTTSETQESFVTSTESEYESTTRGVPEIDIIDVSTDVNMTTQDLNQQITTTPFTYLNLTTETETTSKAAKTNQTSVAVDPVIAVGIAQAIFEEATPFLQEKKAVIVTTTEVPEVTFTTPPVVNATLYDEVTTHVIETTTEAMVARRVVPADPPPPEHPPPIVIQEPLGLKRLKPVSSTSRGFGSLWEQSKPKGTTTQPPPPPIFVPEIAQSRPSESKFSFPSWFRPVHTTAAPVFRYEEPNRKFIKQPVKQGSRHISLAEIAQLALEQLSVSKTPSKGTGLQSFFKPIVPITRQQPKTTTQRPTTERLPLSFKLSDYKGFQSVLPWHQSQTTGPKLTFPGGTNVWATGGGHFPALQQHTTTTERSGIAVRPFQPSPVENLLSKTNQFNLYPSENKLSNTDSFRSPAKQLFSMPKSDSSSNIWGTNDLWRHIQETGTTTLRPDFQVTPIVAPQIAEKSKPFWAQPDASSKQSKDRSTVPFWAQPEKQIKDKPTVSSFEKTQPFWAHTLVPNKRSKDKAVPLFQPPAYDIIGQMGSTDSHGATAVRVQPLVKSNTLFDIPGLDTITPQKQSHPDRTTEVKSVWRAPTIEPMIRPSHEKTLPRSTQEKEPLKDLRASQHDIRFYNKPQTYQYHKPSISLVQDNMLDLFLKTGLAASRSRDSPSSLDLANKVVQDTTPSLHYATTTTRPLTKHTVYKHEPKTTLFEHKTTPYRHRTTPYKHKTTPYMHKTIPVDRAATPLTFEELLLRQLQGDASIFDVRRWSAVSTEKETTERPVVGTGGKIKDKARTDDLIHIQNEPSTRMTTTSTEKVTIVTGTTPVPVAAEHPPPIFDSKVFHTFMPFPKDQPEERGSKKNETKNLVGTSDLRPFGDANEVGQGTCAGCTFVNDRCLLPDPVHCNRYIECVKQGPAVRVFTRECALGSFFDRKSFLCVDPKNADCPSDRCREPGLKSYIIHGHCKHYWVCGSRKGGGIFAQAECCPEGGGFVEREGCVEMKNCTESCDFSKTEEKIVGCKLRKTASPSEYVDENANIIRPCAPGTLFSEPKCTCIQDVTVEHRENTPGGSKCECSYGIPVLSGDKCSCREPTALEKLKAKASVCLPVLNMTFDGGKIQDSSTTRQHVGIQNIAASDKGELIMTAKGRIVLWRYSNLVFSDIFAVRLTFKRSQTGPRYQTLLSNCDPDSGSEPSFDISIDTVYHEVIFLVNTYMSPSKQIKIYYQTNKWSSVYLIYDGERIVAAVDGRVRNIFSGGRIETRPHPIGIGSCGNKLGLHGLVDDVAIFEDCIPDDMYEVFLNVLE